MKKEKKNKSLRQNQKHHFRKKRQTQKSQKMEKNKKRQTEQKGGKEYPTQNNLNYVFDYTPDNNNNQKLTSNNTSYNENLFVRESHNCYTYFLNLKNKDAVDLCKKEFKNYNMCRRAQPGYLSGYPNLENKDYKCPTIMERTLKDNKNIYKVNSIKDKCDPKFYKGALVVAPGRDYHYYRHNDDGFWSHKPGYKPSTIYDSNNNIITDPKLAARDYGETLNYKDFCGYLCIPRNSSRKDMSHRNYSFSKTNPDHNRKLVEKAYTKQNKILNNLGIKKTKNTFKSLGKRVVDFLVTKNNNKTRKNKNK